MHKNWKKNPPFFEKFRLCYSLQHQIFQNTKQFQKLISWVQKKGFKDDNLQKLLITQGESKGSRKKIVLFVFLALSWAKIESGLERVLSCQKKILLSFYQYCITTNESLNTLEFLIALSTPRLFFLPKFSHLHGPY